ncbi:hypothetical protein GCM10007199_29650 [Fictibacillus barbaricus]|nr:hypothetical protein GCM10007199_29650 [Fictibacillus barbaricus]
MALLIFSLYTSYRISKYRKTERNKLHYIPMIAFLLYNFVNNTIGRKSIDSYIVSLN